MNLFVTSDCPIESARALDDKRVRKMVLENCQLLCTAIKTFKHLDLSKIKLYKDSHLQSPVTKWACLNTSHISWVFRHFNALSSEYIFRFNKNHKTIDEMLNPLQKILTDYNLIDYKPITFINAASSKKRNLDFTHLPVCEAYKAYLNARWPNDKIKPKWTKRGKPFWCTYQDKII